MLRVFADLSELSRNRPAGEDTDSDDRVHSPREHFHTYLQSLDVDRGGLPETFRTRLGRVLAHYGVTELDTHPRAARRRCSASSWPSSAPRSDVVVVTTLLQQWVADEAPEPGLADEVREVARPAGARPPSCASRSSATWPAASGSAGSTSRWWRPSGWTSSTGVRGELSYLAANPDAPDHAARIDALAAIPEQIVRFLAASGSSRAIPEREPMLETLARRHYREHELHDLRTAHRRPATVRRRATTAWTTGRPTWSRRCGTLDELADPQARDGLVESVAAQVEAAPEGHESVVDLYLAWPQAPQSPDEASARLAELLVSVPFAKRVRRVAVAVCPGGDRPVSYFSFRPGPDGVVEDDLVRGVHPMVGRRLNLWRLRNFRITRLDAPEDVLLYHCVAEDNEADQRLVALAQIRQFAIVRDAGRRGRLAAARRAGRGQLPGGDPPGAHLTGAQRRPAGHEPRVAAHLAGGRRPAERAHVAAAHHRAADRRAPASRRSSRRAASPARTACRTRSPCASPTSRARGSSPR